MRLLRTIFCLLLLAVCPRGAFAHGDVHGQIEEVTKLIGQDPSNADLYLRRAELHRIHQDWDAAQADYDRAFALNRSLEVLDFARGKMFFEANWPLSAKVSLDRFLARHTNHIEALVTRARALVKLKQHLPAAEDYSRAITLSKEPFPELFLERALALAAEGGPHMEAAVKGLDEGIKRLGPLVTLHLGAIDLELKQKKFDAALGRVDQLTARSPRKETWLERRGEILLKAGRPAEARDAFKSALEALATLPPARRNVPAMLELGKRLRAQLEQPPAPTRASN